MKCPLRGSIDYEDEVIIRYHDMECLKEECAWWSAGGAECFVQRLPLYLANITRSLEAIAKERQREMR